VNEEALPHWVLLRPPQKKISYADNSTILDEVFKREILRVVVQEQDKFVPAR